MNALNILEQYATQYGWDSETMLEIVCDYIDNQDSSQAFTDFLQQQQ